MELSRTTDETPLIRKKQYQDPKHAAKFLPILDEIIKARDNREFTVEQSLVLTDDRGRDTRTFYIYVSNVWEYINLYADPKGIYKELRKQVLIRMLVSSKLQLRLREKVYEDSFPPIEFQSKEYPLFDKVCEWLEGDENEFDSGKVTISPSTLERTIEFLQSLDGVKYSFENDTFKVSRS